MASENGKAGDGNEDHGPRECMPCRGTGNVISKLGGEERTLPCPWCQGSGVKTPGVDTQAAWRERETATAAGTDSPDAPPDAVA